MINNFEHGGVWGSHICEFNCNLQVCVCVGLFFERICGYLGLFWEAWKSDQNFLNNFLNCKASEM